MIIPFLSWVWKKVYKIWISSIDIILENENNIVIKPSDKFIYPETIIVDLSRPTE